MLGERDSSAIGASSFSCSYGTGPSSGRHPYRVVVNEQGVAVGRAFGDRLLGDAGAAAIVHHYLLLQSLGEALREHARVEIDASANGRGNETYRPMRVVLRV